MKLERDDTKPDIHHGWKVIRLDNFADLPGEIVECDDQTGYCVMRRTIAGVWLQRYGIQAWRPGKIENESKEFGSNTIRIVRRR